MTAKVRTERHGGGDISGRVTFQGAKVRKPLAVSGVIDKGNIVVFDGRSFVLPNSCAGVTSVRKAITGVQGIPLHAKTWSLRLADVGQAVDGFQSAGEPLEKAEHQAEQAWTTGKPVQRERMVLIG